MNKLLAIALLLGTVSLAQADVEECKVSSGSVRKATCRRFSGEAALNVDGKIQECKVSSGSVRKATCRNFSGTAPVEKNR